MEIVCNNCFRQFKMFQEVDIGGMPHNHTLISFGIGETLCDVVCVHCGHEFDVTKVSEAKFTVNSKIAPLAPSPLRLFRPVNRY